MKRFLRVVLIVFIPLTMNAKELQVSLGAEAGLLINAKTGKVLFQKNAHKPLYPASITKIATALYALKRLQEGHFSSKTTAKREALASISPSAKQQSNYRCPPYWLETDGSHIGIKKGEEFLLRDLFYAMLLSSANDASNVLAEHIGGTIPAFMEGMNQYLKEMGCKATHFSNPHGLHHPDQQTTASEMALIAREAMKIPFFRKVVSTVRYNSPKTNLELDRNFLQTNLLLRSGRHFYPKAIGIKTGTTSKAGKNLVAAAQDGDRTLIAVLMGCTTVNERYEDAKKLFEAAFNQKQMRQTLLPKGAQKLSKKIAGAKGPLKTYLKEGLFYDFYPAEQGPVKVNIKWMLPALPIAKNAPVAILKILDDQGNSLVETELLAAEELQATLFHKCKLFFTGKICRKLLFLFFGIGVFLFLYKLSNRKRRTI